MNHPTKFLFGATAAFSLSLLTSDANAQGYNIYDRVFNNTYGATQPQRVNLRDLERNILTIDKLAGQMSSRYSWDLRRHLGCPDSQSLYTQMKVHSDLTDRLMKAYQGSCPVTFKAAANRVRSSVTHLEILSKRAKVSGSVLASIEQSCPISTYIQTNAGLFRPVAPQQPAYDPVYFDLGRSIDDIDRMSISMASRYYNEVGHSCGCASTQALLDHFRNHTTLTGNLVKAYRGTCPMSFKKAACDVRDSLTRIETLTNQVNVSCQIETMIKQSCPKASFVHTNANHFKPYIGSRDRSPAPTYGHHNHDWNHTRTVYRN